MKRLFTENELSRKARLAAAEALIPHWRIAEQLRVSPSMLCYWRRHGMTESEYLKIMQAINEIKKGAKEHGKAEV